MIDYRNAPEPPRSWSREITLIGPDSSRVEGRASWSYEGDDHHVTVDGGPTGRLHAADRDFFDALVRIRRQLEPLGWRIAVQGARRDSYPSGMLRDTTGARFVYVFQMGRHVERTDRVGTFDDADPSTLGTIDEQAANYRRWRESLPYPD